MIDSTNISTISDLRFKTKAVFSKASRKPVFLFHRSSPKGVLLSMEKYQEIMSSLEDYYLSLKASEYEEENKKDIKWISENQVKSILRKDNV